MSIWTAAFWRATGERMVRGAAIGAAIYLGKQFGDVLSTGTFNAFDLTWDILGYALGGALVSLILCLIGNAKTGTGPSFNQTEVVSPPAVVPPDPRRAAGDLGHPENLYPPPVTRRDDAV